MNLKFSLPEKALVAELPKVEAVEEPPNVEAVEEEPPNRPEPLELLPPKIPNKIRLKNLKSN